MHSLVVYESLFGNTKLVAEAIAGSLADFGDSRALNVDALSATDLGEAELLVVGVPTHAWGLRRRRTWVPKPSDVQPRTLVREWLPTVPEGDGRPFAAFATRLDQPRVLTGSAAGGVARRLRRRGWSQAVTPASFVVRSSDGPLVDGELDRARRWAENLARAADCSRSAEHACAHPAPDAGAR